jgi:hypothetical protein
VGVDVDEAGHHIQVADVDRLGGAGGVEARRDGSNDPRADRYISHAVRAVAGVDDVSAAQQEVVLGLGLDGAAEDDNAQCTMHDAH